MTQLIYRPFMDWIPEQYRFALNTPQRIAQALRDITENGLVNNDDDPAVVKGELLLTDELFDQIDNAIDRNPGLVTDVIMDELVALAMNSPHRDIRDPYSPYPHPKSPEQSVALRAVNSLGAFEFYLLSDNNSVASRLKNIAMTSGDRDLRIRAVNALSIYAAQKPFSEAALRHIAAKNLDPWVRAHANQKLFEIQPHIIPRYVNMPRP